ncbi:S-methyl-5'-thioadenosine phosphorylase [Mizuhopecten yessoensis]|uniref:S-methyl-5'-thioadenosine phosphorylase n=1 Tax=Mizuhopecten yessoensis TaxID=6573 RepID=A0A210QEW3_MIZYE|nr:S-methyl-5'-thioadenosine phosphorylase [Mizuhopecten yessoensis]
MSVKIGIIGGSGLSDPDLLKNGAEQEVDTPFGKPSDSLKTGEIAGVPCVLLARHGRSHATMPTNVNFRANIWALKMVGCTHLLVTTACGSLQENIHPGEIVVLDQFIDRIWSSPTRCYHIATDREEIHHFDFSYTIA